MASKKQINFPVTEAEHEDIKNLARRERRSIKNLILHAFDQCYPGWSSEDFAKDVDGDDDE